MYTYNAHTHQTSVYHPVAVKAFVLSWARLKGPAVRAQGLRRKKPKLWQSRACLEMNGKCVCVCKTIL